MPAWHIDARGQKTKLVSVHIRHLSPMWLQCDTRPVDLSGFIRNGVLMSSPVGHGWAGATSVGCTANRSFLAPNTSDLLLTEHSWLENGVEI